MVTRCELRGKNYEKRLFLYSVERGTRNTEHLTQLIAIFPSA